MKKEQTLHMIMIAISGLTLILVAIQFFCLKSSIAQAIEHSEAMKVGGMENYASLKMLYNSDGFKSAQKQQIEAALAQMNGQQANAGAQQGDNAAPSGDGFPSGKLTDDQLSKLKKGAYINGDKDAAITIVEYSDPECPFCIRHHNDKTIDNVMKAFPDKVNHILKVVQGVNHPGTHYKSLAILCAGDLGGSKGYYGMFDQILGNSTPEAPSATGQIVAFAKTIGVNASKLGTCVDTKATEAAYAANWQEAISFQSTGTPGNLIINNKTGEWKLIAGAYPADTFNQLISAWLK